MTSEELSYIAGFLDGDGCIMLQLVPHKTYRLGYQIRSSIVFYQKKSNYDFMLWLKDKLKDGYIRVRNDGMVEYTIVGFKAVTNVLNQIIPFLRLKQEQARLVLQVSAQMPEKEMSPELLLKLAEEVDKFTFLNYSKRRMNTSSKVRKFLEERFRIP